MRLPATRGRDGGALLLIGLIFGALVIRFWFVCDDALISFRYSQHWAEGEGVRFNLGDAPPVEGYSNFLWVAVCAGVARFGGDIQQIAPAISAVCGLVLLVLLYGGLRRRESLSTTRALLATLSLAAFPPFAVWATSGLETMPFVLLLYVAFVAMGLRKAGPDPLGGGLAAALLCLVRVEGLAWAVVVGAAAACCRWSERREAGRLRAFAIYAGAVLLATLGMLVFRWNTYGQLLSNTAHAKAGFSIEVLQRGLDYLGVYFLTFLTPLMLIPLSVRALRNRECSQCGAALVCWATVAYAAVVGGDFMTMGRLLVPFSPFAALLLAGWIRSLRSTATAAVVSCGIVLVGLLPAFDVHLVPETVRAKLHFRHNTPDYRSEYAQWEMMQDVTHWRTLGARALDEHSKPGDSLVMGAVGAFGYFTDLFIYDRYGLVTREVAERAGTAVKQRSPGHDKVVPPEFFLDRDPTFLIVRVVPFGQVRKLVDTWSRRSYAQDYVPEVLRLESPDPQGVPEVRFLLFLERVGDRDATAVWRGFGDKLQALRWARN